MSKFRNTALALAAAGMLAACSVGRDTADETAATIDSNVEQAVAEARVKIAEGNITVSGKSGAPKAEITPQGDLLIDGKAVPVTDAQRAQLLDYRTHVAGVATAGMDIGVQGARLGATAAREALRGVFSGQGDAVAERVKAQAEPIREAALRLCDRLPGMYDAQQRLAASLPAFAPYATMDPSDIEACKRDAVDGDTTTAASADPSQTDEPAASR